MAVELVDCPDCGQKCEPRWGLGSHRSQEHGWSAPHGTTSKVAQGCRCPACREANRRDKSNRRIPKPRRGWAPGRNPAGLSRDIARQCEDRDDPADPRRDDVAILHLGASKALCARTSGVMEAMIRGLSESR